MEYCINLELCWQHWLSVIVLVKLLLLSSVSSLSSLHDQLGPLRCLRMTSADSTSAQINRWEVVFRFDLGVILRMSPGVITEFSWQDVGLASQCLMCLSWALSHVESWHLTISSISGCRPVCLLPFSCSLFVRLSLTGFKWSLNSVRT